MWFQSLLIHLWEDPLVTLGIVIFLFVCVYVIGALKQKQDH